MSTMLRFLCCLLLFLAVAPARSADEIAPVQPDARAADNGENIHQVAAVRPASSEQQSNAGSDPASSAPFCAQLWLVGERSFFAVAARGPLPAFRPVRNAARGQQFFTAIFFANSTPDARGAASVNYDVTVRRPDGMLYGQRKALVGCQGPLAAQAAATENPVLSTLPVPALQLGRDYLGVLVGETDPAGVYTVEALVRDRIGNVELTLKTTFTVL